MALVRCPDCGEPVSDLALACPKCGCPQHRGASIAEQRPSVLLRLLAGACILLVVVSLLVLAIRTLLPPEDTWEYAIVGIPDLEFEGEMSALGAQGWELVFARRARDSATDDFIYECILKRRAEGSSRSSEPALRAPAAALTSVCQRAADHLRGCIEEYCAAAPPADPICEAFHSEDLGEVPECTAEAAAAARAMLDLTCEQLFGAP